MVKDKTEQPEPQEPEVIKQPFVVSLINSVGRPLKFKSSEEVEQLGKTYFIKCIENKEPITITGLALSLNSTRQQLIEYENKEQFKDTIKMLKTVCENYAEKKLFKGSNQTGAIFALKQYGWQDDTTGMKGVVAIAINITNKSGLLSEAEAKQISQKSS